jgi:hypothetical protein
MDQSITVLLADGRLIDAKLPAGAALSASALAAKYGFADQVTIECKTIPEFWDAAANLPRSLELQSIRFLRKPESKELSRAVQSPDWRRPGNLLRPPADAAAAAPAPPHAGVSSGRYQALLEKARTVNLDRAAHLPNFVADEDAVCATQAAGQTDWQQTASVQSEVTFKGMNETRQQVDSQGKPVPSQGIPVGCIGWSGGFGAFLRPLFDPKCGTTLTFSKLVGDPGKEGYVYDFSTPPEGCFPPTFAAGERTYAAHEGSVLIDSPSGNLLSVIGRARDFPKGYAIAGIRETVTWDVVKLGGEAHLLPVSYEKEMSIWNGGVRRVTAVYRNHRHFEANTSIVFQ